MCSCCHYFIAMHIMIFQLPYSANELVYIISRLYQKWSQKTLNSKFSWVGMPPDPLKTVVPMHYTSVNAFTDQADHSNSTGYGHVLLCLLFYILYIMELSVSRNLACVLYFWSRSIFLVSSLKHLAPCALDLTSFLRQHLTLLATRERK